MKGPYARVLLIPFCFIALQASAQAYYPGGLGNANLFLWLDANKSTSLTLSGTQVSQWADLSGNGYNFTQATGGNQPSYSATGSPSGRPALTFTSTSSQYLSIANLPASLVFTSGFTGFNQVSYSATQTVQGWQRIFDFGNGQSSNNFMMGRYGNSSNTYYEGWNGGSGDQTYTTTNPIVNGSENLYEAVQAAGAAGSLTAVSHYLAGSAQAATGAAGSSITHVPNAIARTSNYIGRSNWAADNYFSGTMSEILLYNSALNTTQRVIIENYLSAEWNQTVSVSKYTPPTVTTYTTNLVGIGYTSAADNFTADVSGSTDGLGFSSGTTGADFLSAAGYVMAAHNGQANTVITNASVPGVSSAGALTRWNRSWNVQVTGGTSTGAVTLNFNFPDYSGGSFNTANTFTLLYNATDGTFASGSNKLITTLATTATASTVSFKVTASNLANGYYTILYSSSPIVLPVTLAGFSATARGNAALLQWTTASAVAFSHFEVERSGDGNNFSVIGTVAATGNTANADQFSFTDNNPLQGTNYYRLAMVDLDGTTAWSSIHSVNFGATVTLSVYPNPVVSEVHLVLPRGADAIRLYNCQGQLLRSRNAVASGTAEIAMNGLAKGVYFLAIDGAGGHDVRTVMKE